MNIVLFEPEIPANTGNIGRTCVASDTALHLIEPLGFRLNDKMVKRSGLDYWDRLDLHRHIDWEHFYKEHGSGTLFFATTKARRRYDEVSYPEDAYIVFGKESAGIPEEILVEHEEGCIRIPMAGDTRSLNLSNAVSIILYEALRQNGFMGLNEKGNLHRLKW